MSLDIPRDMPRLHAMERHNASLMLLQYFGKDLGIVPNEESDKPSKNLRRALVKTSHGYSFGIEPERASKAAAGLRCARRC